MKTLKKTTFGRVLNLIAMLCLCWVSVLVSVEFHAVCKGSEYQGDVYSSVYDISGKCGVIDKKGTVIYDEAVGLCQVQLFGSRRYKKQKYIMETNNCSQREKILKNFISDSEFVAIRISSVVGSQNDIFLYTTATGNLQLIRLREIGYSHYNSKGRQWETMLYDGHVLKLKRSVNSQVILDYHLFLTQVSQSFILNINYLVPIEENNYVLFSPFNTVENLQITSPFLRKFKERYPSF